MTKSTDLSKAARAHFQRVKKNKALRFFAKPFGPGKWRTRVVWPTQAGRVEKLTNEGFTEVTK